MMKYRSDLFIFKQSGAISILYLLLLPFMLTFIAFTFDLAKAYTAKTELQNAVDACALAAAKELNGTAKQFAMADAAGVNVGNKFKYDFQQTDVSMATNANVRFGTNIKSFEGTQASALSGVSNATARQYKYVQCTATQNINKLISFQGLTGADTMTATAMASVVPIQSACALPIGVCSNASAVTGNNVGTWISGTVGSNTACNSTTNVGCFRWVTYNDPLDSKGNANAKKLTTLLQGDNTCSIKLSGQATTIFAGATAAPFDEYNTRFGIVKSNVTGTPDYSGYAYPDGKILNSNAYSDFLTQRGKLQPYQNSGQNSLPNNSGSLISLTSSNTKNRRIGVVPVINCASTTKDSVANSVKQWACVLMLNPVFNGAGKNTLRLEYLGPGNAGACTDLGLAGASGGEEDEHDDDEDGEEYGVPTTAALVQ